MDKDNIYEYLGKILTSTDYYDIPNTDCKVTFKYIDAKKVNLDKINACIDEIFPKNKKTRKIFRSLDAVCKIKKRYSSLQGRNDTINQLEDFIIDKAKNYLVNNLNIYINTLNISNERDQIISQIKKKCYELRFYDKVQEKYFLKDSIDSITLYEKPYVNIK